MSKIEYPILQYDTSLLLFTSLLVQNQNRSYGIKLTSLTTLLAIMKLISSPKSTVFVNCIVNDDLVNAMPNMEKMLIQFATLV